MRILLLLVVAFFSTNTLSQTHLSVAGAKQIPLLRFTDKLWSDRAAALPLPGTYERCGNYLFTFTPSEELGVQHRRMIGFATIGAKGGIGDIVIWRGTDVHIIEGAPGKNIVAVDATPRKHNNTVPPEYIVFLSHEEYRTVHQCLRVKKDARDENKLYI